METYSMVCGKKEEMMQALLAYRGDTGHRIFRWADIIRWPETALEKFLFYTASNGICMSDMM
jgi:hypothetical protein